ncbi:hypothetical protein RHGRI_026328 [Rhododendron griersonianum]|uniref:Uncharacterized protein n=1 Tax=Rhododendron griersonianum TaxID=479676 RepID=A0AAV6IW52_9ERIC|nr:hypothetical protein RHGRI_026328 [Rhododendron griersonianum]
MPKDAELDEDMQGRDDFLEGPLLLLRTATRVPPTGFKQGRAMGQHTDEDSRVDGDYNQSLHTEVQLEQQERQRGRMNNQARERWRKGYGFGRGFGRRIGKGRWDGCCDVGKFIIKFKGDLAKNLSYLHFLSSRSYKHLLQSNIRTNVPYESA